MADDVGNSALPTDMEKPLPERGRAKAPRRDGPHLDEVDGPHPLTEAYDVGSIAEQADAALAMGRGISNKRTARRTAEKLAAGEPLRDLDDPKLKRKNTWKRGSSVDHDMDVEKWLPLAVAYRQEPSARHVSAETGLSMDIVERAIHIGWPKRGIPPLKRVGPPPVEVYREIAKRQGVEAADAEKVAATAAAAKDATAAEKAIDIALQAADIVQALASLLMSRIEEGRLVLPVVKPADIHQFVQSAERLGSSLERAVRLRRLSAGQPETVIGVQIGTLVMSCTPEEREQIRLTGRLPARVLGLPVAKQPGFEGPIDVEPIESPAPKALPPGPGVFRERAPVLSLKDLLDKDGPLTEGLEDAVEDD